MGSAGPPEEKREQWPDGRYMQAWASTQDLAARRQDAPHAPVSLHSHQLLFILDILILLSLRDPYLDYIDAPWRGHLQSVT